MEVKWLAYGHNCVITELGKKQILIPNPELFPPYTVLEALSGEELWNDSPEIPVSLSKVFVISDESILLHKRFEYRFILWCYWLTLDSWQPASVSQNAQETYWMMEKLFFSIFVLILFQNPESQLPFSCPINYTSTHKWHEHEVKWHNLFKGRGRIEWFRV